MDLIHEEEAIPMKQNHHDPHKNVVLGSLALGGG